MMSMSTWAIRKPVPSISLFLVLCIVGIFSFKSLPVTRFPNIDVPIISITVAQVGAAPSEMASQILEPLEAAVFDITGVKHITSEASDSVAQLIIEFDLEVETDRALSDVKNAIEGVRSDLPESITEPVVQRVDVIGMPVLYYSISDATRSIEELSYFVDEVLAREVQAAKGVGKVARLGGADRQILVELNSEAIEGFGLSVSSVSNQLRTKNINLGGGRGVLAGQEYSIRALGSAKDVDTLSATQIAIGNGQTVRLDQLGTVTDGQTEMRNFALFNGQPVVAFAIWRKSGASDLVAGEAAKAKLEAVKARYPDLVVSEVADATIYTEGTYHSSMETLYEGAFLAIVVVMLFLRDWRATVITAVALPLSIIPTFFMMDLLGFSLNTISLLGITLVTGILVDDAIVEIENIVRHIQMGKPAYEASEEAADEIGMTVIAISFTIVAVFVPVSFMSGIAGQYFKQFGLTVAIAVLFSLLVARLITPMMAAYFMKNNTNHHEPEDGAVMRGYMKILRWTLKHRAATLAIGVVIFALSIFSATLLPQEFVPASDSGTSSVSVELPPGSRLEDTIRTSQDMGKKILEIPEVTNVFVDGGSGGINLSTLIVNYGQKNERSRSNKEINVDILAAVKQIPDIKANLLREDGTRDLQMNIVGDTQEATVLAANKLVDEMRSVKELANPATTLGLPRPEIQITPKNGVADALGIDAVTLASTIQLATLGDSEANLAKFNAGDRQIPILVRMEEAQLNDLSNLSAMQIQTASGVSVPLGAVADIVTTTGPSTIERYDRKYKATIEADLAAGVALGTGQKALEELPTALNMPDGVELRKSGDAEIQGEVFTGFIMAMGAGFLLVYVVLVLLFSSFMTPVTILVSLPFAIGGAIFGLYICNYAIGLSVFIGFLMLMGIVTKNAIMLVEFAIVAMEQGKTKEEAMLDAGHKRARPIVMTTIAMAAGMLPSAIGIGQGGEFKSPMAVAVIGGLLVSTVLSLLFVPSVFSIVQGLKVRVRRSLFTVFGANKPEGAE